mgnify:CR=1 FL=1
MNPGRRQPQHHLVRKAILLSFFSALWISNGLAEECPEESYILKTQADVEALGALGCSQITKTLFIRGDAIGSVEGLGNVVSVGALSIQATQLASLKGLENPVTAGVLSVDFNTALRDLDSIAGVNVSQAVTLWGNSALENVDGLFGITEVTGNLYVFDNPPL